LKNLKEDILMSSPKESYDKMYGKKDSSTQVIKDWQDERKQNQDCATSIH